MKKIFTRLNFLLIFLFVGVMLLNASCSENTIEDIKIIEKGKQPKNDVPPDDPREPEGFKPYNP